MQSKSRLSVLSAWLIYKDWFAQFLFSQETVLSFTLSDIVCLEETKNVHSLLGQPTAVQVSIKLFKLGSCSSNFKPLQKQESHNLLLLLKCFLTINLLLGLPLNPLE